MFVYVFIMGFIVGVFFFMKCKHHDSFEFLVPFNILTPRTLPGHNKGAMAIC